jgi:tetratricopeptide (TPR) repeat protein
MLAKIVDKMVISSELERMKEATALVEQAGALINEESSDETSLSKEAHSLYLQALTIQESFVGWCHEETARTYHQMGWLAYNDENYPRALGYLLQSLRISHRIYGEDHPSTSLLLDDIQDLLEDMKLETEYGNRIFESWALQDEANDLLDEDDKHCEDALELYRQALEHLPAEVELERAHIFCQIASLMRREQHIEEALSYYCQALMIFPKWLSPSFHPRIVATRKQSHEVAAKLTPIGSNTSPLSRCSSCRTERSYSRQASLQARE